jgi:hypothetical protein
MGGGRQIANMTDDFSGKTHNRVLVALDNIKHVFQLWAMAETYRHTGGIGHENIFSRVISWEMWLNLSR